MNTNPEMLDFLKAMSDADRLRIIGLLTQRRASRVDIVAKLNIKADTLSKAIRAGRLHKPLKKRS